MSNRIELSTWRHIVFRRVRDNRIATLNTVNYIGTKSISLVVLVEWVGSQKALFVLGRRVWLNKKARRYTYND